MATKKKPKKTEARATLAKNLDRTRALQRIFEAGSLKPQPGDKRGGGQPSGEERELLRAVVVFAIGALDSYLSDVAAETLVAQLEKSAIPSESARALLRRMMKEVDTLALELALTTDPTQRRAVAREAISDHLSNKVSNHGPKGIAETMSRLGTEANLSKIDMTPFAPLQTTERKSAPDVLQYWTDRRHALVHQGVAIKVNMEQSRALIDFVEALADHVESQALASMA